MKLFYSSGACSMSPHIVLREAGLKFDLEKVDLGAKKTASGGDFNQVNPKGYVPALQLDDGSILTEGPAIVQYLADKAPAAKLAPANGTVERARLQEWLNFISTELHKTFGPLFGKDAPDDYKEKLKERIGGRIAYVEKQLAGKQFVMGGQFTVADAYLWTILSWGQYVGIDIAKWPAVKAYFDRVGARPSVQATLKAEGLAK